MEYFTIGLALLANLAMWGAGLAWGICPPRWRSLWPCLIPVSGFSLQSAVVWLGSYAGLTGTNSYAREALVIPCALLLAAAWRGRAEKFVAPLLVAWPAALLVVATGCAALLPQALANRELTTVSLGSCDAADYAAGTRVFMEFARADRSGFLGLTEVVRLGSCDNFFDFWLRLNHFSPSAICALNASTFGLKIHEVTGVMTVLFWVSLFPSSFFLARAGVRLSKRTSLAVALLATLSPISFYAVAQVAMAQLLATSAIAVLTAAGLILWRHRAHETSLTWMACLFVVFSLLLGAYNFILLVAWTPAAAVVAWDVARRGGIRHSGFWFLRLMLPLMLASVFWWDRAAGIAERFRLFRAVDFGWKIPLVGPEGWLGGVATPGLDAWSGPLRLMALMVVTGALVAAWWGANRRRKRWMLLLPLAPLCGYAFLQVRGLWLGNNASYDAYKILAVFTPMLVLPWGAALSAQRKPVLRMLPIFAGAVALVFAANSVSLFAAALRRPPLQVTPELASLGVLERRAEVGSLNLVIDDFWTRLWANAYLLRKPQYFATPTYEGRNATEFLGSHDLQALPIKGGDGGTWMTINSQFALSEAGQIVVKWGSGWYPAEQSSRSTRYWRWTESHGRIEVKSRLGGKARVEVVVRGISPRVIHLAIDGRRVAQIHAEAGFARFRLEGIEVPAGDSIWTLESDEAPVSPGGSDSRRLNFAVSLFSVQLNPATP